MAIYHCSVKVVSRSTGRSSVGAAAYRAGDKLTNDRDGITHDYTRKTGITHNEIMLPENAPQEYQDRNTLWNAVEKSEKRKDAQTAREVEVALPVELKKREQIELLREYVKDNFVKHGMCADIAIHDKKDGNPHAHILLTTRDITPDGFQGKNRAWNDRAVLQDWREQWAVVCNRAFEKKNIPERIDHRTLQAQGIDREPTIHKGTTAHQMEKRGNQTDRGRHNQEVRARNMAYERDFDELQRLVDELKRERAQEQEPPEIQLNRQQQQQQQQEPAPAASGGAVQNPEREDEQASRNIQRGGGLAREEYADAKAEEMNPADPRRDMARELAELQQEQQAAQEPTKPKPTGGGSSGDGADSAERVAQRLQSLKSEYMSLDREIHSASADNTARRDEQRKLESRAEQMSEAATSIQRMSQRTAQLQQERDGLGMFKGKEKKHLDEQIQSLKNSQEQATKTFRRDFGIEPGQAQSEIDKLRKQAQAIGSQGRGGQGMDDWKKQIEAQKQLQQKLQGIELEYKTQKALAAIHPDSKKINDILSQADTRGGAYSQGMAGMRERMATAQAESRLNNTTMNDYKKIVQRVDPDKAQKIVDHVKAHTPVKGQSRNSPTRGGIGMDR